MSIAFSDSTIIFDDSIDGSTTASLLAGIRACILAQGDWTESAITGGYEYLVESPQNLACKIRIWDPGSYSIGGVGDHIYLQVRSEDGTIEGYEHPLDVTADKVFQCWVNACQIFIAVPGESDGTGLTLGDAAAAGIPFVPTDEIDGTITDECGQERATGLTTDAWWSCGDRINGAGAGYQQNFRTDYRCSVAWSACRNASLVNIDNTVGAVGGAGTVSLLQLVPITPSSDVDPFFGLDPAPTQYTGDYADPNTGLKLNAIIGWGEPAQTPVRVRGLLWDAFIYSTSRPLDEQWNPFLSEGNTSLWINWTESNNITFGAGSYYCSLSLLLEEGVSIGFGNVAY